MKKHIFLCLFGALALLAAPSRAQVVVIANSGVSASSISRTEILDVFTGSATSLKGGVQITPVLLKQGTTHSQFLDLYIGKSDSAFRATWRSLLFSGQGVIPRSMDSEAATVEYVAHTRGAIGYIAKATPHEGVKVLDVR